MSLQKYQLKRDSSTTSESKRKANVHAQSLTYVIQKHVASHLHYDFRLAWNGVLKSWVLPKRPSNKAGEKRLAIEVEDHPLEYAFFEAEIPQGQYGGGTVTLWDQGTWQPLEEDVEQGLQKGELRFCLYGKRLKEEWILLRMRSIGAKHNWLLIKPRPSVLVCH